MKVNGIVIGAAKYSVLRVVGAVGFLLALGACQTESGSGFAKEGIGYREARFTEITALRGYRSCTEEAQALDVKARETRSPARYLASARLIERCETELGMGAAGLATEERMRNYALAVHNYVRGGDLKKARETFERFHTAFPNQDLYYADGSSFVDATRALLGQASDQEMGRFSMLNINRTLKAEMSRMSHWTNN